MKRETKPAPKKLEELTLPELRDLWPKSDDGKLCARLLQRYGFTLLIESTIGAECTELRAQAESGASKAIAKIVKDFGILGAESEPPPKPKTMAPLHRFQASTPSEKQ